MSQAVFYYDVSSPYAYLAAVRVDGLIPNAEWRPIAFGVLLRETGRVPWSLNPDTRPAGVAEVEQRAAQRGLPPVAWPPGWPADSYSLTPLRALHYAQSIEKLKELTAALYEKMFVEGIALDELAAVLDAANTAGIDPAELQAGIEGEQARGALREATAEAIARGVVGVPTVAVGDELFWGDDRLEDAASSASRSNL
jgi:2-hydroxychromene-2-carboxylate isomerase